MYYVKSNNKNNDQDSEGKYKTAKDCSRWNRTENIIARTVEGSKEQYRAVRDCIM